MNNKIIIFLGILLFGIEAQEFRPVNFNLDEIIEDAIYDSIDEPNDSNDDLFDQISADHADKLQELLSQKHWQDHLPIWVKRFGIILLMRIAEFREYCTMQWYRVKNRAHQ